MTVTMAPRTHGPRMDGSFPCVLVVSNVPADPITRVDGGTKTRTRSLDTATPVDGVEKRSRFHSLFIHVREKDEDEKKDAEPFFFTPKVSLEGEDSETDDDSDIDSVQAVVHLEQEEASDAMIIQPNIITREKSTAIPLEEDSDEDELDHVEEGEYYKRVMDMLFSETEQQLNSEEASGSFSDLVLLSDEEDDEDYNESISPEPELSLLCDDDEILWNDDGTSLHMEGSFAAAIGGTPVVPDSTNNAMLLRPPPRSSTGSLLLSLGHLMTLVEEEEEEEADDCAVDEDDPHSSSNQPQKQNSAQPQDSYPLACSSSKDYTLCQSPPSYCSLALGPAINHNQEAPKRGVTLIQRAARRHVAQRRWNRQKRAVRILQRYWRTSVTARKRLAEVAAVTVIQRFLRNRRGQRAYAAHFEESRPTDKQRRQEQVNVLANILHRRLEPCLNSRKNYAARIIQKAVARHRCNRCIHERERHASASKRSLEWDTIPEGSLYGNKGSTLDVRETAKDTLDSSVPVSPPTKRNISLENEERPIDLDALRQRWRHLVFAFVVVLGAIAVSQRQEFWRLDAKTSAVILRGSIFPVANKRPVRDRSTVETNQTASTNSTAEVTLIEFKNGSCKLRSRDKESRSSLGFSRTAEWEWIAKAIR